MAFDFNCKGAQLRRLLFAGLCIAGSPSARAQVSVTATAGTAGPTAYTTLKGAFDAINSGTHQGAVTVSITASTTETATASLNASGTGSASFTRVLVQPGAGATPTVSGAIASGPLLRLNGASNVTINGSNNNTTSRDLTLSNTSATAPQVLVIGSVGTTPVTADTIRNCSVANGAQTSTALIVGDAAAPGTAGYFSAIGIQNNSIQKAYIGMYLTAVPGGTNGSGTLVTGNTLNSTGTNSVRLCGIYLQGINGATVSSNTVGNFEGANPEFDRGIWLATATINTTVSGNTVSGLTYTGATAGYAPIGINISPGVTNANIAVRDNTVSGISTASTGTATGIYFYSAASGIALERNQVSNIKNTNAGGYGAAGFNLVGGLAAGAVTVTNNFVWDVAGYGSTIWTPDGNGNGIVVDGGGGYSIYHNTVWMNTSQTATGGTRSSALLISANVAATNSINLRNNLLVNTQTTGNANSRMALIVLAPTTVFSTFNYNNYYATSGNLAAQGTNATIWNTIAQIQTNMGGNANSSSVQPTFVSGTDLHLQVVAANAALNNTGVALAAVTTDIDNDARSSTPDIGADEFGNCMPVTFTTQPAATATCSGRNASFTAAATNGTAIQWQVNAGSGFVNVTNGGVYGGATSSTLTITAAPATMNGYSYRAQAGYSALCPLVSSNTAVLTVNPTPSAAVAASGPTTFCAGNSVTLSTAASGATLLYKWRDGGTPVTGATSASYTASSSGSFSVIVADGATGCADTSAPTVVTVGSGPAAAITPAGPVSICQGSTTTLSAGTTPGVSYEWLRNGTPIAGATANTYTANDGGSYTVTVSTSPTCKTTSSPATVVVNPLPVVPVSSAGSPAICQGSTVQLYTQYAAGVSYQWLQNGNPIPGATGVNYLTAAAGTYRVLAVNNTTTCRDTSTTLVVVVNPLPAATILPAAPPAICQGTTATLAANAGAGFAYQWFLDGMPLTGALGGSYAASQGGAYTVRVTDGNGCQNLSAVVPLTVNPAPPAQITYNSPLQFCAGSAVVLNAFPDAGTSYQWQKDGVDLPGVTGLQYTVYDPGAYTLRTVNGFGCVRLSDTVTVTVYPKPVPVITRTGDRLSTSLYNSYQWYFNGAPVATDGTGDTLIPTRAGGYRVTVTDANGCEGTSETFFLNSLGIAGNALAAGAVTVYPNPAATDMTVESTSGALRTVTLHNTLGAVVYTQAVWGRTARIPVEGLAAGMYYLRAETTAGVQLLKVEVLR